MTSASQEFHIGLALRPQDFWLNFYEGLCAYQLKRFEEAVNAFRVAIALSPEAAECYYNRGLAYQALGRLDEAMADYGRALKINEQFTDAALNRAHDSLSPRSPRCCPPRSGSRADVGLRP